MARWHKIPGHVWGLNSNGRNPVARRRWRVQHWRHGDETLARCAMSSATMTRPAETSEKPKVAHAPASAPVFVEGRRNFFKYRDLGVTVASDGRMRAQVTIGSQGLTRPTGWHHHVCEGQFIYMLSGW